MKPVKEPYFTPENIEYKSAEIKESMAGIRHALPFLPGKAALLVLDMQSYFLDESSHAFVPSTAAILPRVNLLITSFAALTLPIFFTRHVNTPQNAGMMAAWWKDLIDPEQQMSEIDQRLKTETGIILTKTRYDAFMDSPLEGYLHQMQVQQVVVCGVMTHLCCESTARSAFMRGFEVFFTIDGTATYSEAHHRASLLNLSHGFAVPVCVGELLTSLESNRNG